MAVTLPNGTKTAIASTYGSSITIESITAASPPVVTATAHGLTDGDIIEVNSGWPGIDGRIARVANSDTNTFELEGFDTTGYTAGAGVGTVREVTAWTEITQTLNQQAAGGEPSFYTYKFQEDETNTEKQIKTGKSATSVTLTLADDQSKPWFAVLVAADKDGLNRAVRQTLPNNALIYSNVNVAFNEIPNLTSNEAITNTCTLSNQAKVTRYAS
ncbi:MAG: phage tail protein [Gammaproteobacteria bacterium]|nr:phage tail protein [Gammaproteobacteria bacterium]MCP5013818.1 phage tail protein [Ketobacter sp.]